MAKLEEADPRWIVAERTDGHNVNNWHWTEKNCLPWAKERLPQLLVDTKIIDNGDDSIRITKVDNVGGECHINTRKGKIFHFYELEIKLKWEGKLKGEVVEGSIEMPEVSFENEIDEHEINVNVTKAANKSIIKDIMRAQAIPQCRKLLSQFLNDFKDMKGYLQEVKEVKPFVQPAPVKLEDLPVASPSTQAPAQPVVQHPVSPAVAAAPSVPEPEPKTTKLQTTTVEFSDKFGARPSEIYQALMDPRRIEAYTQSSVQLEAKEGGKFALFGGNVTGEFVELKPDEKIVQKWRTSTWPEGHYSTVTIKLSEGKKGCDMKLKQDGVPVTEAERTQQAWKENIFERLKRMFGYGMGGFGSSPF